MSAGGDVVATVDGQRFKAGFVSAGRGFSVILRGATHDFTIPDPLDVDVATEGDTGALKSPMPGKIVAVMAEAGAPCEEGHGPCRHGSDEDGADACGGGRWRHSLGQCRARDQVEAGAALVVFEVKKDEA